MSSQEILERIAELESELTVDGNSARDKMIEQGSLLNKAVEDGLALKEVAHRCGLTLANARVRSSVAARLNTKAGYQCQEMLSAHEHVLISFDALASVLSDPDPVTLLARLIADAEAAEKTRITRDAVRQGKGNKPGTVGTASATSARLMSDPAYMAALVAELSKTVEGRMTLRQMFGSMATPSREPDPIPERSADEITSAVHRAVQYTTRLFESVQEMAPLSQKYQDILVAACDQQIQRYELLKSQVIGGTITGELEAMLSGGE